MFGYLYVAAALAAGLTKGWCGKKTSGIITGMRPTLLFNAVRMLLCIPIGLLFVSQSGSLTGLVTDPLTALISAVSGVSTALFVVTWIGCVRWGAYMMVDVFVTLGIILPVFLSTLLLGEELRAAHLLGLALLVFAAYMMCTYDRSLHRDRPRLHTKQLLLLMLCGITNGMTQFSQKWLRHVGDADISVFNFYTYVFASAVLLLLWILCPRSSDTPRISSSDLRRLALFVTLMSACLFLHSFCSTAAAGYLPSAQLYPLMQGSALILSMLMSAVCFGERINLRCAVGIASSFAAMLCIEFL